jgi:hypothetical protein
MMFYLRALTASVYYGVDRSLQVRLPTLHSLSALQQAFLTYPTVFDLVEIILNTMARLDSPVTTVIDSELDSRHIIADSIKNLDVELRDINAKVNSHSQIHVAQAENITRFTTIQSWAMRNSR